MSKPTKALWDERLMCDVISLGYDFHSRTGRLYMAHGNCCDMTGCVELFEAIDSEAEAIHTYSGDKADTAYRREGKKWKALSGKP
jgi:hypothetical protein